jgi:hypothetical protein
MWIVLVPNTLRSGRRIKLQIAGLKIRVNMVIVMYTILIYFSFNFNDELGWDTRLFLIKQ